MTHKGNAVAISTIKMDFDANKDILSFHPQGRLDIDAVASSWQPVLDALKQHAPQTLIIDAKAVDYCDSSGASFLLELQHQQGTRAFSLVNLDPLFQPLIDAISAVKVEKEKIYHHPSYGFVSGLGRWTAIWLKELYDTTVYLGELSAELVGAIVRPRRVRWKTVWDLIEKTGPNALPIVLLLGFLMGLILSFQSAIPLKRFGAVSYIPNLVGISLTRELGPLMVGIILAGRTASSFAAEIGTMKVNQELDALSTMGIRPMLFLVLPRLLAVMLMSPLLDVFMIAIGLAGCALFMHAVGYPWDVFYTRINAAVTAGDLIGGMFKSAVFGILIAGIGCRHGLLTRFGATAVGDSTTQAVVNSIIMIVVADGIFAVLFYVLKI